MAKRMHDNEIWSQDWFLEMQSEYKMLWFWVLDKCDHAGIWKPNKRGFEITTQIQVDLDKALNFFNSEKERIFITKKCHWFVIDFFQFQYGRILNENNKVHQSILQIYEFEGISQFMVRGLLEVKLTSIRPLFEDKDRVKDKDKDKDTKGVLKGDDFESRPQNGDILTTFEDLKKTLNEEK